MSENYKTIEYITLPPEKTEEGQPEQEAKTYEVADKTWRESPLFNIKTGDIIRWNRKGSGGGSNILDQDGKIEQEYFPSWVNDVLQFNGQETFPQVGESDKIYIDQISNLLYRWNGNEYIVISSPPSEEEEEIEYSTISPIGVTENNEIFHQDSGVNAGTYKGNAAKQQGHYIPSFTIDSKGHITSATNLGELIPIIGSLNSSTYGDMKGSLITEIYYNYEVRTPSNIGNKYILTAGNLSNSFNITDPGSTYSGKNYFSIINVLAMDQSGQPVIVDWSVSYPVSTGGKSDQVLLTVNIKQAYNQNIFIKPIIAYQTIGM